MRPFNLKGEHPKRERKYKVNRAIVYDDDGKFVEINFGGKNIFDIHKRVLRKELVAFCNRMYRKRHFYKAKIEAEWFNTPVSERSSNNVCKIAYRHCSMEFFIYDAIRFPLYYTNKELESTDNWRDKNIELFKSHPLYRKKMWDNVDVRNVEIAGLLASWINIGSNKNLITQKCAELHSYIGDDPYSFIMSRSYVYLGLEQSEYFFDDYTYGDLIYFFGKIRDLYERYSCLENAVLITHSRKGLDLADSLISLFEGCEGFKHVTTCRKRMNTFLRWMVLGWRVDLGVWKRVSPKLLKPSVSINEFITARKLWLIDGKLSADYPERVAERARYLFPECPSFLDYALIGHFLMERKKSKYKITKIFNLPDKNISRTLLRVSRGKSRGTKYKYEEIQEWR